MQLVTATEGDRKSHYLYDEDRPSKAIRAFWEDMESLGRDPDPEGLQCRDVQGGTVERAFIHPGGDYVELHSTRRLHIRDRTMAHELKKDEDQDVFVHVSKEGVVQAYWRAAEVAKGPVSQDGPIPFFTPVESA